MAEARLRVAVAVLTFDPDPALPRGRALQLLTTGGELPAGDARPKETVVEAALRVVTEAGVRSLGRAGRGAALRLLGVDDQVDRARVLTCWYGANVPFETVESPAAWAPVGRASQRGGPAGSAPVQLALTRLRGEARFVAGVAPLLGDIFTTDDLIRLHAAIHGGIEGSERTFRRRVQELRERGILRGVRSSDVPAARRRVSRFRSALGTGGRPPELLRYSGSGGEDESLTLLRNRRT